MADLSVSKLSDPVELLIGESLTYTLFASNQGPSTATGVVLTDTLPSGLSLVSIEESKGTCSDIDGIVCDLGDILPDENITITIVTTAIADGVLPNTVVIRSEITDLNPGDNLDSIETIVNPIADLSVSQTDHPDPVTAQALLEYTVTIHNDGPSDADNVILEDILDPGVTYESVSPSGTACSLVDQTLTCDLGILPADQTIVLTITTRTKKETVGTITNSIQVSSDALDPFTSDNASVVTTYLPPDTADPTVTWVLPVTVGKTYPVGGGIVRLEVTATDNVAVDYVQFWWWDKVAKVWNVIGRDYTQPYQWDFNTFILHPGPNEIAVRAYDTAGNPSATPRIWLNYTPPPYVVFVPLVMK
jgi:uncharacterized repeat protein (TIGR01451 family)